MTTRAKVLFTILAIIAILILANQINTYKMEGTVIDYNTVQDEKGHIWEYDHDLRTGDKVIITFQAKGANSRLDDIVKEVKGISNEN